VRKSSLLLIGSGLATLANVAAATQTCNSVTIPLTPTNWTIPATVPKFDPSLGTLNGVVIQLTVSQLNTIQVESALTVPADVTTHIETPVLVLLPDLTFVTSVAPFGEYTDSLSAFDGTVDYAGTSGFTHAGINGVAGISVQLVNAGALAMFTGTAGNPGTISLPVIATGNHSFTVVSVAVGFGANVVVSYQASALVNVCYNFTPNTPSVSSYCSGDGVAGATPCPCGNNSATGAGQGCLNSTGIGAILSANGVPSVANDTLTLTCNGLPMGTSALLYQGTGMGGGAGGMVFGDGLRCVGGTVVRLGSQAATGSSATWPMAGQGPLSQAGSVPANSQRDYQVWYRNAIPFCTPATFNLSQALNVSWSS
jgi:hypothetical protein